MSDAARKPTDTVTALAPGRARLPAERPSRLVEALANGSGVARAQFVDFLPDVEAISQRRHSPAATWLVALTLALLVAVVVWMAFSTVEQVATAPGMVRPAGKVKIVNHPDGGRIAEILVKDGDRVEEGQELLRLDPELIRQEVVKLEGNWHNVGTEVVRLQAELEGREPAFDAAFDARKDLVENQRSLFFARRQELATRRSQADAVVAQQGQKIETLKTRIAASTRSLVVLRDQEGKMRTLAGQGYFPEFQYQNIKRRLIEEEGALAGHRSELVQAEKELLEAQDKRAVLDQEWRTQSLKRLGDALAERDRIEGALRQQNALLRNLSLRAPVAGIVEKLNFTTVGQSVKPGDVVTNIVPIDDTVIVEARVGNDDIGYVAVNQPASIKVQTYDWVRFGTLKGVVSQISADAALDAKTNVPYFVVLVNTDRNYLGAKPGERPVLPGMTATVDLHLGERSILQYFLQRIEGTIDSAFRER
ncbi:MAG: HlyD family type I secretion periplasmic adaptor subunit [Reyranellaceae bacterium]